MDWSFQSILIYLLLPAIVGTIIHELIVAGPKRRKRKKENGNQEK